MNKWASWMVLILIVGACGGSAGEVSTSVSNGLGTQPATTDQNNPSTTVTADASTTAIPSSSSAKFAITMVSLGDLGQVVIQNVGGEAASLAGHWLCQRPSYYELPDLVLQPGESAAISVGGDIFVPPEGAIVVDGIAAIGPFDPASGEVGLYLGNAFSDPGAILSYVEWGSSGHGRSETAVSAQIWTEGGFVPTSADSGAILATSIPSTEPGHWIGG